AKVIKSESGVITAYDGDRIMAIFHGDGQTTRAAKCGLMINYAVREIINPAIKVQYPKTTFAVKQVVGIDTGTIRAARTRVRGDNALVWVGRAANYAAKLTEINLVESTWLTEDAYKNLQNSSKLSKDNQHMWKLYTWTQNGNKP